MVDRALDRTGVPVGRQPSLPSPAEARRGSGAAALTSEVVAAGGAKAAVSAVAASATQLSTTQRTLLDRLAQVTSFDPEPLAEAVVEAPLPRAAAVAIGRLLDRA